MNTTTRAAIFAAMLGASTACDLDRDAALAPGERNAVADTIRALIVAAYDFSRLQTPAGADSVVERLMSLYPEHGPVISAGGGRVTTSRDSLEAGIRQFWKNVGVNMRAPSVRWDTMHIEVLSPHAAVVTAIYRIPHTTPQGVPHTVAGAMTAVFARRDGRWVIVQEHLSDAPR